MSKLKSIVNWTITIAVLVLVIYFSVYYGKKLNYWLFYEDSVKEYVDPKVKELENRISILESNAEVRLH